MLRIYGDTVVIVGVRGSRKGIVLSSCLSNTRPMAVEVAEPDYRDTPWPPQGDPGDETDAE